MACQWYDYRTLWKAGHPVLKHVTDNKGIYITAVSGSDAKAVYDGIVTQRFSVLEQQRHHCQTGNFLSVYANLTKIYINVGDKVNTGDKIGKIFRDLTTNTGLPYFSKSGRRKIFKIQRNG